MQGTVLEALLSQDSRLVEIRSAAPAPLLVESMSGREAINELFRFDVDCVATNAYLPLSELLGIQFSLRLRLADGHLRTWHGYCTHAAPLGSDGGLARYRLTLEPWLALLAQGRRNRVFQDLDLRGLCDALFAGYRMHANWRFDLTRTLRQRALRIQHRESDFDFLLRLLAEEGISFRFEHEQTEQDDKTAERARHCMVLFDHRAAPAPGPQERIRFHRADATEADDTIQTLTDEHRVGANAVSRSSWNYRALVAAAAQASGGAGDSDLPALEDHDGSGASRYASEAEAAEHAGLVLSGHEARYRRLGGGGSVRSLAAGTHFTLEGHAQFSGENASFAVLSVEHRAANNLGSGVAALLPTRGVERGSYRNEFVLQPSAAPILPTPRRKPAAQPETALVVGEAGAALTTDRDHRIRIQFHWQRGERPNPGGLATTNLPNGDEHAPGDERSGIWVRVAEWLSGPDWGSHFLPRTGTEVLIDFVDGDIDRPLVVGQLYGGIDLPPFSAGEASGANHPGVISGWSSDTHAGNGQGFNQWLADDTPGQLRTRLATSHAASQLSLGHLVEQAPHSLVRGPWRGAGLELRTDGWLALRAGDGVLISSTARPQGASTQMDVAEAVAQLRGAEQTAQALSDAAMAQSARPLAANTRQSAFIDAIDAAREGHFNGRIGGQDAMKARPGSREPDAPTERFAQPFIVTEGPDDIGLSTPASTLLFAGAHLHATAQKDFHAAAARSFSATVGAGASWFSHSGGIRSIAAAGSQTIQAHTDAMEILADQSVSVTSSNDEIHVLAKDRIVLQAGQSSVTLQGGDITFACPGTFSVKGAGHAFEGPATNPVAAAHLPSDKVSVPPENVEFRYAYHDGEPVKGAEYSAYLSDGSTRHGRLDEQGYMHLENVKPGGVEIRVGSDIRPYTNFKLPARPDEDLDTWIKG
ncbi:MAG: type VI secretion system secreted protein VgrG [Azoarcus sp.]|uniref:Type VI secretion system secreted protein VgrG n=1 Tax=Aromatoleum tolulyticum TaxID=34027 RepID=A0A1N6X4U7_9RHOO|nr:type VI secretion system Vgr family protein [Aromatoleum tolulyticum]MCK9986073.1 type VI secretion system secreted protein VgrG [Azoarcus sp.]SIQ97384.1 type VI secretion system secreted protein VgrG [Aromatoleum tolulyticum]